MGLNFPSYAVFKKTAYDTRPQRRINGPSVQQNLSHSFEQFRFIQAELDLIDSLIGDNICLPNGATVPLAHRPLIGLLMEVSDKLLLDLGFREDFSEERANTLWGAKTPFDFAHLLVGATHQLRNDTKGPAGILAQFLPDLSSYPLITAYESWTRSCGKPLKVDQS